MKNNQSHPHSGKNPKTIGQKQQNWNACGDQSNWKWGGGGEKKEEKNTAFIIDNQKQLINSNAFQLQKDFVQLDEEGDEGDLADEGVWDSADDNIQQQLMCDFDDLEDFDENEDDVQAALKF